MGWVLRGPTRKGPIMIDIANQLTIRELWEYQARERADEEFLVFVDQDADQAERYTYAQFDAVINQVASMLQSLGVGFGSKVAVQLPNSVEFLELLFALGKIGAVMVPLSPSYTSREAAYMTELCDVELLISTPELYAMPGMDELVCNVVLVGDEGPSGYSALKNAETTELAENGQIRDSDLAEIMFTSGTTSLPKGVMFTQANLIFSGMYVNWEMSMTPADRYLTTMDATHVNFQLSALMPVLTAGATLIFVRRYSASRFWKQVREHDATVVQGMAMIVRTMLRQPVDPGERDHNVRDMHYFLPITNAEKAEFTERFGVDLLNNYGSSETLVGVITDTPLQPRNFPSIGRPGLGYEVRIVNEVGIDAAPGRCGEILVRGVLGRTLMAGYWKDPEASEKAISRDGWYRTGDWGYQDKKGWIYFLDRGVDLIKRSGENVSAIEVEDALMQFPGVDAVAVIGVPDEVRDEAVKAFVVPKPGVTLSEEELLDFARSQLACFKVPSFIEIRDSLPRGSYGKVLKKLLKDECDNANKEEERQ